MKKRIATALIKIARRLHSEVEPIQTHNVIVSQESKAQLLKANAIVEERHLEQMPAEYAVRAEQIAHAQIKDKLLKEVSKYIEIRTQPSAVFSGLEYEARITIFKP